MSDALVRQELETLQGLFRNQGFDRPATLRILLEWGYNLSLAFGGLAGWFLLRPWWLASAALLVSTLGMVGISTMAHTAAHGAGLPWRWANTFLGFFGYPFMGMVSIHYWRHKHNRVHHPNPNVIGVDTDCDLMPLFAMNETEVRSAGRARQFYYRYVQGWVFPLALALNLFNVQRFGWAHLIGQLADTRVRRTAHWLDLVVLLAHVGVWIMLPCFLFSPGEALLLYFLRVALLGHFMFFAFAPAHFPAEADFVDAVSAEHNFIMRQIQGTVNFRTGPIGRLACNGVEFQIEHHLFPNVCHVYYPRMAPLVREFCRENGYPYRALGWGEAILKSYAAMFRPRPIRQLARRYEGLPGPVSEISVLPMEPEPGLPRPEADD
jgi:linoleoyl-CoA desaturase